MSMEIFYELKDERLHLVSVIKDLTAESQSLKGRLRFIDNEQDFKKIQNKINFIHFRRCEAEKRITEINNNCSKIGREYNQKCFALKNKNKRCEVK